MSNKNQGDGAGIPPPSFGGASPMPPPPGPALQPGMDKPPLAKPPMPGAPSVPGMPPMPGPDLPVFGRKAFKSAHGKYLSAQPDGRAEWNRDKPLDWERVEVLPLGGGKAALRSCHGKYLSAQADGRLEWNRDKPLDWEAWTYECRGAPDRIALKSCHGAYLSAQANGTAAASAKAAGPGETFTLEKA